MKEEYEEKLNTYVISTSILLFLEVLFFTRGNRDSGYSTVFNLFSNYSIPCQYDNEATL